MHHRFWEILTSLERVGVYAISLLYRFTKSLFQNMSFIFQFTVSKQQGRFFRAVAGNYLRKAGETRGTVIIDISVGKMQIVCTIYMQVFFHFTDPNASNFTGPPLCSQ